MHIDQIAQNHPELVVNDLAQHGIDPEIVRHVLKWCGINKWLRNRRLIIQLKERWKKQIRIDQIAAEKAKAEGRYKDYVIHTTRMNVLANCRQQVRAICHSARDVDFPQESFGEICCLSADFPDRPKTRYLKDIL
jgi:hypothetical protein